MKHHIDQQQHSSNKHAGHSTKMFVTRFWICLLLTIPTVWFSGLLQKTFAIPFQSEEWMMYASAIIGTVVFLYGGLIFIKGAVRELREKAPGMMTLITLAIVTAFFYSIYATAVGIGEPLWWELTTLITVMLFGHWMEMNAVQGVQSSLHEIAKLLPDTAIVIKKNGEVTIPVDQLKEGDLVLIRPGSSIPADGIVLEGVTQVNESLVTGESRPVSKKEKSEVIAGTMNGDGAITIRVEKTGDKTFIASVMRLINDAQLSKSKLQLLSDRAAFYLTIIAIIAGIITLTTWLLVGDSAYALERMVAVLVVACPHALGLAVPLVAALSTSIAAKNGTLIRQRLALEEMRLVDTVVFDKTGTLTTGVYGVQEVILNPLHKRSETEILIMAASINSKSEHPAANAIVGEAKRRSLKLMKVTNFERIPGKGVQGTIAGVRVMVGGEAIVKDVRSSLSKKMEQDIGRHSKQGKTIIFVMEDNALIGAIALADQIRKESKSAILELKKQGITPVMLTGDAQEVAVWVASELGIKEFTAKVMPGDKVKKIMTLQKKGHKVAMVGDGINDAPALAQANVGIAIGGGTNIAIDSAGIILVKNDPGDVVKIIDLSKATYRKMLQNLWWASGYNIVAIPLAAGAFVQVGWVLQPAVSALIMSISTIIVALNALSLRTAIAKRSKNSIN